MTPGFALSCQWNFLPRTPSFGGISAEGANASLAQSAKLILMTSQKKSRFPRQEQQERENGRLRQKR